MRVSLLLFLACVSWLLSSAGSPFKPLLINGREALSGELPEVVYISTAGAKCTATLVGPRVIITAAHCADTGATSRFQVGQTIYTAKITRSPVYQEGVAAKDHDIAAGLVDQEVTDVKYASIGGTAEKGKKITLAGYGCTTSEGSGGNDGKLRIGDSEITGFSNFDMVSSMSGGAALCFGDSGGPAFVQLGDTFTDDHYLLGVNSKGNIRDTNWNTRTDTPESQDFLKNFASDNNVEICGINKDCVDGGGGGGGGGGGETECSDRFYEADNARKLLDIRMKELGSCLKKGS